MFQDTYRVIFSMVKDYNSLLREKKEVSLAHKTWSTFPGIMLPCQTVYLLFFLNNQYIHVKIEGFTPSAALHDHEKTGHNQSYSQARKGTLLTGSVKD